MRMLHMPSMNCSHWSFHLCDMVQRRSNFYKKGGLQKRDPCKKTESRGRSVITCPAKNLGFCKTPRVSIKEVSFCKNASVSATQFLQKPRQVAMSLGVPTHPSIPSGVRPSSSDGLQSNRVRVGSVHARRCVHRPTTERVRPRAPSALRAAVCRSPQGAEGGRTPSH